MAQGGGPKYDTETKQKQNAGAQKHGKRYSLSTSFSALP